MDILTDKARLIARISELIDPGRQASGIEPATRRGRAVRADRELSAAQRSEFREFLKSAQEHHIVPLWDLQLAGLARLIHDGGDLEVAEVS